MQTKEELEQWYENEDPWEYQINPDDRFRKCAILSNLYKFKYERFQRALDIGAGEGYITKDLPAIQIDAIEVSDKAASRFPKWVNRVNEPNGYYDLIICTGVLYNQYNHVKISEWIKKHSLSCVLIAGVEEWLIKYDFGKLISETRLKKYRDLNQIIKMYDCTITT